MKKRVFCVLCVIGMLLSFSGCSFVNLDMETQLRAPYAEGEQNAIQTALQQHIYDANAQTGDTSNVSYVLKYPKMGEYRSAFVMKDIDGDGVEDALAFYALQPEGAKTHIAVLKKTGGSWKCVDDIEGLATEIERITFGDLNGDGRCELLAGFSMYNTRDRRLELYSWSGEQFVSRFSDTYTHMIVGRIGQTDRDDVLLFRLNAENAKTTVRLMTMQGEELVERGSTALDGYILQFGDYAFASFSDTVKGVYQDCAKDVETTITELIVWDGEKLTAPLYDPVGNITTLSARQSAIPSMDIDGDGEIEWPRSYYRNNSTDTPSVERLICEWYSWDHVKQLPKKEMTNVTNVEDGYYVTIPESWIGSVTASYDTAKRTLTVSQLKEDGTTGDMLFMIAAFAVGESNPNANDEYLFLDSTEQMHYEIRYNRNSTMALNMNLLSDLFVVMKTQ
ncbi:MAG: hypothetical protein IKV35_04445 [Clostridia bacterium]|nr:hypothetical protein [Clostridia bacterium]